jgi:hypothetical protein
MLGHHAALFVHQSHETLCRPLAHRWALASPGPCSEMVRHAIICMKKARRDACDYNAVGMAGIDKDSVDSHKGSFYKPWGQDFSKAAKRGE